MSTTSDGDSVVTTSRIETRKPGRLTLQVQVGGETIMDVDKTETRLGQVNGTATRTMSCAGSTACDEACQPGEVCTLRCAAGRCNQSCAAGGTCNVSCVGGGCDQRCAAGASCVLSCEGGGCTQACSSGGAQCVRTCGAKGGCRT